MTPSKVSICLVMSLALFACDSPSSSDKGLGAKKVSDKRHFRIRYIAEVSKLSKGKEARVWIPIPANTAHQEITKISVKAPLKWRKTERSGNRMIVLEGASPGESLSVEVSYEVVRLENSGSKAGKVEFRKSSLGRLVIVTPEIARMAKEAVAGQKTNFQRGKALYKKVLDHMSYDKSGKGWGQGDSRYACDVGKGNCTDFHSLFMAMCQTQKIPSRFKMGLYGSMVKKDKEYKTGGYHCWAEFYDGESWIPVDISEADKDPSRADYFFGNHSANRVTLSVGRDVTLNPAQKGEALNFFINPYVEVEGVVHESVTKQAYWKDL